MPACSSPLRAGSPHSQGRPPACLFFVFSWERRHLACLFFTFAGWKPTLPGRNPALLLILLFSSPRSARASRPQKTIPSREGWPQAGVGSWNVSPTKPTPPLTRHKEETCPPTAQQRRDTFPLSLQGGDGEALSVGLAAGVTRHLPPHQAHVAWAVSPSGT